MKEFRAFRSVLLVAILLLTGCHRTQTASKAADLCECGPDFCLSDPRHPPKLAQKKSALRAQGFPADLVALLDPDGQCVAAVDRGPDTFTILLVKANGDNSTTPWTQQDGNSQWNHQGILQAQCEKGVCLLQREKGRRTCRLGPSTELE